MVQAIDIVGGTKDVKWQVCESLNPDLVILDREENTKDMAAACPFPWYATHITSVNEMGVQLHALAEVVQNNNLHALAEGWAGLSQSNAEVQPAWDQLPGLVEKIGSWDQNFTRIEYIIWKDPWMAISRNTFIGSVLQQVGFGSKVSHYETSYPELGDLVPDENTFYMFSTEPYPFARVVGELQGSGFNGALVDGEFYSWFGSRSYRLLKAYMEAVQ